MIKRPIVPYYQQPSPDHIGMKAVFYNPLAKGITAGVVIDVGSDSWRIRTKDKSVHSMPASYIWEIKDFKELEDHQVESIQGYKADQISIASPNEAAVKVLAQLRRHGSVWLSVDLKDDDHTDTVSWLQNLASITKAFQIECFYEDLYVLYEERVKDTSPTLYLAKYV